MATLDIEPRCGQPFQARTLSCELPDACLTTCFLTCARTCRHSEHCMRDGSDDIMLLRPVGGPLTVEQDGRTVQIAAGDAVLVSTAKPWTWDVSALSRLDCLRVPRRSVRSAPANLIATLPRPVGQDVAAFQLLAHYGGALLQGILPLATADTRRMAATHIQDLLRLLLGAGEQDNQASPETRLSRIKQEIDGRLSDRSLTVDAIARLHGVTARTVQKLFGAEGTTFSEYVLKRRLGLAWKALRSQPERKITDIAYEAGFGDLSYFNRAFRQHYKMTPRQARTAEA